MPAVPVSFSIKPKDEPPNSLPAKAALPMEPSSDEEEQNHSDTKSNVPNLSLASILPLQPPKMLANINDTNKNGQSPSTGFKSKYNSFSSEVEQSDSFIRDTMLEHDALNDEKKDAKRAEDKVKNRLAQLAREKLGILSKEKQLQLERKKRAMAFLNQITGTFLISLEYMHQMNHSQIYVGAPITPAEVSVENNPSNDTAVATVTADSDSSDSVTFITASPGMMKRQRNFRNTKIDNEDVNEEDDDVVEVRSRSHSRTRCV